MKKIIKFSKTYKNILGIKKDFYTNNLSNLNNITKINNFYKKQPIRKNCKNCKSRNLKSFIKNFGIEYKICKNCGHINGQYQDTEKFAKKLYSMNKGKNYSNYYLSDYDLRVKNIYAPKVDFLTKVIKKKFRLMDIGCGAGHFIKALENRKIFATGYDTSKDLCELGKKKIKKNKIINTRLNDVYKIVRSGNNFCLY